MGNKSSKKHYKVPSNAAKPDPPGKPEAETQENGIYLQWIQPKSDGKCPIIGYIVQHSELDEGIWHSSDPIPGTECLIHNLENGATYLFRVIAENLIGYSGPSIISEPVLFSTAFAYPRFVTKLHNVSAIENEKVEFQVQVTGRPNPQLKWYHNDEQILSSPNFVLTNQRLTINCVKNELQGEIKCSATNEVGTEHSTAELTVGAPPRIQEESSREIICRVDELLRIKFTFSGRPNPESSWFHNGIPLMEDDYNIETTGSSSLLKLIHASRINRGEYTLKLENNLGMDTGSVLVTVADKPCPPSTPTVALLRDNSCMLEWEEGKDDGGCPVQCYITEYFRAGWDVWLTGATSRTKVAKIRDLIPGSKYKFRIKAENLYGLSEPSGESAELFIPELSSGLMTPLTEAEEEDEKGHWVDNLPSTEIIETKEILQPPVLPLRNPSPKPITFTSTDSKKMDEHFLAKSQPDILPMSSTENFRPRESSLIFDHYTSIKPRPNSPRPTTDSKTLRENLNLSMRTLDQGLKPWNQSKSSDKLPITEALLLNQSKAYSLPREISGKNFMTRNNRDGSPTTPQSSSTSSSVSHISHLIFEGSSSDEEEEKSIVTCSSLTVLKSGDCQIKTCSREELTKSFDNITKTTSASKNSLNSEDFEYYNSIFSKTYNIEDDEEHQNFTQKQLTEEDLHQEELTSWTYLSDSNQSNSVEEEIESTTISPEITTEPEVDTNSHSSWWWYFLIIPISLCLFLKYTFYANISIMLYVFYRLVMLFFE